MGRDWGIITAVLIGLFFTILAFIISLSGVNFFIAFSFITVSEIILFIVGLTLWRDRKAFGPDLDITHLKKKYFLLIISLVLYAIGIFVWIFLYHSDSILEISYITVLPFLLITISYFNVFFEPAKSKISGNESVETPKLSPKIVNVENYKNLFMIPLIFSIVASIVFFILPWYSTTSNIFNQNAYYNCPTFPNCNATDYTSQYTAYFNFQNAGLSRFLVYFIMLVAIIGGILIYLSYKDIIFKQSNLKLRIGMLVLSADSFITIFSLLTLYYYLIALTGNSAPPVVYYALEPGILLGIMFVLFATAVAMNINKTIHRILSKT